MLQSLHDLIKGWVAKILFGLIAITFAFFGTRNYFQESQRTDIKAVVNGEKITERELRDNYRRLAQQIAAESGADSALTPENETRLKEEALKKLITQTVLNQKAQDLGFFVSIPMAEQMLIQIPAFQQDGKFSKAKFEQVIHSAMYTPESYIQQLQKGIVANQLQAGLVGTEFSLPSDISRTYELARQERDFRYLLIKSASFAGHSEPTKAEQEAYYKAHESQYTIPEKVKLEYVSLSIPDLMAKESLSDKEVKNYYETNLSNYHTPARWKVAHILLPVTAGETVNTVMKRVKDGEDFAKLVKEFSIDKLTANQGGVLPLLTAENLPPTLANSIMGFKQDGQVDGPIATPYGFEILKCVKYEAPQPMAFDSVSASIRETILRDRVQLQFASLSEDLANLSYQNPDSLKTVAQKLSLKIKSTDWISKDEKSSDSFVGNRKIVQAAFSEDVLNNRNNSEAIQISDEAVAVIRVKEHQPATVKPFDQVQTDVIKHLNQEHQEKLAAELMQKLTQTLQSQHPIESLLEAHHLTWQSLQDQPRNSTKAPIEIVKAVFEMSPATGQQLALTGMKLPSGDYALVQLQGISKKPLKKMDKEERNILRTQSENNRGMMAYQLLTKSIESKAKVVIHD